MYQISDRILLTLWIGGMWIVGYMVVPVLFNMLDRQLAGNVAGQLFSIMGYIGMVCGILLLAGMLYRDSLSNWMQWRVLLLITMLVILVIGQFDLQPMMVELKSAGLQGANADRFSHLHGVSSILFLVNSLAGLALVVFGLSGKDS